jgi:DNA (cytosine-5)-methyltransferase 1
MAAYYNDTDPYVCAWLRNLIGAGLITPGDVDERSIKDVKPDDLRGYAQCHFFAGIGGWSISLRLAGWPDDRPVWTGSCPCQPFSSAARGRQSRRQDQKHLWPTWRALIAECQPRTIIGEQTSSAGDWFDEVCDDMEDMGYAIGAAILPAVALGFDHARPRLFFVCHANGEGKSTLPVHEKMAGLPRHREQSVNVVQAHGIPARASKLRAYGNAIVPQVAAAFIAGYMDL